MSTTPTSSHTVLRYGLFCVNGERDADGRTNLYGVADDFYVERFPARFATLSLLLGFRNNPPAPMTQDVQLRFFDPSGKEFARAEGGSIRFQRPAGQETGFSQGLVNLDGFTFPTEGWYLVGVDLDGAFVGGVGVNILKLP